MQRFLIKTALVLTCLTLTAVPLPVRAQSPALAMTIGTNPTSVKPGGTVGVFALVTNNSTSRVRTTVSFTSLASCGIQTSLGSHKLVLEPGQSIQVTVSYPIAPNACSGVYTVTISGGGGGKGSVGSSASCYLTVQ